MNQLPIPTGLALYEHYCRRWLTAQLLRETDDQDVSWERPLVGVQMSEFLETGDRFLCIGFARPLILTPHVTSSTVIGFRDEPNLAQVIRFVNDPEIPSAMIGETCERCMLSADQCSVRAAEPTILQEEQVKTKRRAALDRLMVQFQG
jgi:hypothetical protein